MANYKIIKPFVIRMTVVEVEYLNDDEKAEVEARGD